MTSGKNRMSTIETAMIASEGARKSKGS